MTMDITSNNNDYGTEFLTTGELTAESISYAWTGLIPFIEVAFASQGKHYSAQPFHHTIANNLELCMVGKESRLIINLPPRSGKTVLLEHFCLFTLGYFPASNNIWVSYAQSLSTESSARIRQAINSDWYRQIFPNTIMAKDTDAKMRFATIDNETSLRGDFVSVGAGGSITGKGAGIKSNPNSPTSYGGAIIVDDPIKPDDAKSDTSRDSINKWFYNTLYSRTNSPSTPIIIVMQRLHELDLTGYLLELDKNNTDDSHTKWNQILLPVMNSSNESIWNSTYPVKDMLRLKANAPSVYLTQYMQSPTPDEGVLFLNEHIQYRNISSIDLNTGLVIISTDFATTQDGGDYTVLSVLHISETNDITLIDMYRGRVSPDKWSIKLVELIAKHSPKYILVESGVIFNATENIIRTAMTDSGNYASIKKISRTRDKESSSQTFLGLFNDKKFYIGDISTRTDVVSELLSFPTGKHDDIVDTFALLGMDWKNIHNSNISSSIDIDYTVQY